MHKHTDPASAATELLKRRSIRNNLTEWARHKGFEPALHHHLFIREIEAFSKARTRCCCCLPLRVQQNRLTCQFCCLLGISLQTLTTAYSQLPTTWSLPSGGEEGL